MKKIIFLTVLTAIFGWSCAPLKQAYKSASKGDCLKAEKHLNKISSKIKGAYPVSFGLAKAWIYEVCGSKDSSCHYYSLSLNDYCKLEGNKDKKFLDKKGIKKGWIVGKIKSLKCKTSIEKFLEYFEDNHNEKTFSDLEKYVDKLGKDSSLAPASHALCNGLYNEFVINNRKKACEHYKFFLDERNRTCYDYLIIDGKRKLLNDSFIKRRLDVCKYYCEIVIDDLLDEGCKDKNYISENLDLSNSNEVLIFPITNLFANGIYYLYCLQDTNEFCIKINEILKHGESLDSLYKFKYKKVINDFIKKSNCKIILSKILEAPMEVLEDGIKEMEEEIVKPIIFHGDTIKPEFTGEVYESTSLIFRIDYNADIWTFYDSLGLGIFKTPLLDTLLDNAIIGLNDFNRRFDSVNIELYALGLADGTKIGNIIYNNEFGTKKSKQKYFVANIDSVIKSGCNWQWDTSRFEFINFNDLRKLTDKDLAFLRAYNVIKMERRLNATKIKTKYFIYDFPDVPEYEKRPGYRRFEIIILLRNVLESMKENYEQIREDIKTWDERVRDLFKERD